MIAGFVWMIWLICMMIAGFVCVSMTCMNVGSMGWHGSRCYWIGIQIQPSTNASHTPFVSRSAHHLQAHHILQQTFFSTHARNLNPKAQCHDQSFNTTYIQTMATQITQILETGRQNSLQSIGNDYAKDRFRDIFLINCGIFWTNSAKYRISMVIFRNI